ncbi:HD domain-containing protein [Marinagarivorans cellulosilyticus]|uniref:Guanosine-3',5'-bis(Diphosphate) 3'-pyrophosphohydrolase n=1 Tax=Marinagarivorans cellulosilyticus TaxID=2721545 RepID=A0AAN1WKF6_9GAMM|nr:HD domain-containing protein [Marinagarivorans cellulosilyticus]BCD99219.1 guanosine-3',5'-bis(diphosphate) 3'-pyrophosphohydrolase [Marinagarivorans cellulosilyticus]
MSELLLALSVAAAAHKGQIRKGSGEPYINHLIEVSHLLSEHVDAIDVEVLQAAVLHDILEDTSVSREELLLQFGSKVLAYVEALTDDKTLPLSQRRDQQLSHITGESKAVKLIKLADLCSNVSSIPPSWSETKTADYLDWTHQVASMCFDANEDLANKFMSRYDASLLAAQARFGNAQSGGEI